MDQIQQNTSQAIENRFEYDGQTGKVFGIWIINLLLNMITIGIYSFWGKTRMRKYVANSFSLLGDRFEYTGTGLELLLGYLKALPVIMLISLPLVLFDSAQNPWVAIMFIPIMFLIFLATYGALRYRMSRTTWRGIRGKLTGSAFSFALQKVIRTFLNVISLGLLIPSSDIKIYSFIAENSHFGNARLRFDGTAKPLFGINLITLLLVIPTIGLSRFWYLASLIRHQYAHTTINHLHFKATHTGGSLLGLFLVNGLIIIFTLGIGAPIVIQRKLRYFSEHVSLLGDINTSGVLQSDEKLGASGEGLDEAFGLDSGII